MQKVQILGTGCPKCRALAQNAADAIAALDLDCEVEKITAVNDIISYGVMMTPALAIDGKVESVGKLLTVDQIKDVLRKASEA